MDAAPVYANHAASEDCRGRRWSQGFGFRDVIDTITSKAVLILGRFTDERKAVLDALREELRKRDYLPILFDFAVPALRDVQGLLEVRLGASGLPIRGA
jgi:hypothetical protein